MSFDRSRTAFVLLTAACMAGLAGTAAAAAPVTNRAVGTARAGLAEAYGRLPLAFEANRGQADPRVQFLSRGNGYTLFLASTGAVLSLSRPGVAGRTADTPQHETAVLRMKVLGANEAAKAVGTAEMPGRSHYFIGNDPAAWRAGVPSYAAVRYEGVYPGVDLVYHGSSQRELEYDFVVGPGADPRQIRLGFEGAHRIRLDRAGNLVLQAAAGDVAWRAPVAYQEDGGTRRPVAARYEIKGPREVAFHVASYDHRKPLVIDPVLAYSTYLGGSSLERGFGIAVDGVGSAYVTGLACSLDFPTRDPLQATLAGATSCDAFVTKFSPGGNSLVYSTYLGGASTDVAQGIAVDASGSAHIVGQTCSNDFPTVTPAQAAYAGGCDAFVAKLSPTGAALVYATYLGGTAQDLGQALAVDAAGSAYATGLTFAPNFPTSNALQGAIGSTSSTDAFVTKLSPAGDALVYSTYLGGASLDTGTGIAVDSSGSAYVVGSTQSTNFPVANAFQASKGGTSDLFLAKLSPAGTTLTFSTYLGGNCSTGGWGVALDAAGSAYVTGTTCSTNFPVANALQGTKAGTAASADIFVTKFAPAGSPLVYSTFLGGTSAEIGRGVAVDAAGNAYVTGWTFSTDFPTVNPVQAANAGPYDVVIARISAAGTSLDYSTYLGGSDDDFRQTGGNGIAVDASGNAYVVNTTVSSDFPTVNAFQATRAGNFDAVVFKLVPDVPAADPVANAGADQTAAEGTIVTLDGAASTDPNGDPLTYLWEQVAGPPVSLSDATSAQPFFTAPSVPLGGATLTFRLTVSDGVHTSEPETVDITVTNVNRVPEAHAGDDQTVQEGSPVTLRGGDSFDPDGETLTYEWMQNAGTPVTLSDPNAASPTFTAPLVGSAGETLVFIVTVSDGLAESTDEVHVVVSNVNQVPTAETGSDQTVDEGTEVTLQGTASSDADGDALTYSWTQVSGPAVTLSDPASSTPSFTAPAVGAGGEALVFRLMVGDGAASSAPDTVTITVRDSNQPPSCELAQATLMSLWPPNHRLVEVGIAAVADPEDGNVAITITSVTQDEPVNGQGDGDTSPDAVLQGDSVLLRSERSATGTGRVYAVTFTAQDENGAVCTGSVTVCVPHDRRAEACVDEGPAYDSLLP